MGENYSECIIQLLIVMMCDSPMQVDIRHINSWPLFHTLAVHNSRLLVT